MSTAGVDIAAGAARRRRERRLRSWLKHERMTVAKALAEASHHTAPRGQRTARAREWESELNYMVTIRRTPTPQAAGTQYFAMDVDEVPAVVGSRPDRLSDVSGPQERRTNAQCFCAADGRTAVGRCLRTARYPGPPAGY